MKSIFRKLHAIRIYPLIGYPVLIFFAFFVTGVGSFYYVRHAVVADAAGLIPFEGTITNVEYNCLCEFAIMLTISPIATTETQATGAPINLLFFYAAQILETLGLDLPGPLPPPRVYAWYQIFYPGPQRLLGNYVPAEIPCVAYVGTACSINGYAQGAILNVGTQL